LQGQKERAEELERILLADFMPVVDALVRPAEAELDTHVVVSAERFSHLGRDLLRCSIDASRMPRPAAATRPRQRKKPRS
jgi:hypothetical protein